MEKIYCTWIVYFGSPHKFLIDNGIPNKNYREMKEKLNMEAQTTTDESLFSKLNSRKGINGLRNLFEDYS